jgi:multisubunit Na+/H+ antiporter MnhG subunit
MEQKKRANLTPLIVGAVCIILAAAGGIRMHHMISRLNGWQAAGYALVEGIFIALVAAILNEILSFFSGE